MEKSQGEFIKHVLNRIWSQRATYPTQTQMIHVQSAFDVNNI